MLARTAALVLLAANVAAASEPVPSAPEQPRFTIQMDDHGAMWFQGPGGRKFLSTGIDHVAPAAIHSPPNTEFYNAAESQFGGSFDRWAADCTRILREAGANTLGAWSDERIPLSDNLLLTPCLYVVGFENSRPLDALKPDFEAEVRRNAKAAIGLLTDREHVLGVFLDNEMSWFGKTGWDRIPNFTLLEVALARPAGDPIRASAVEFIRARHATLEDLSQAYGQPIDSWAKFDEAYSRASLRNAAIADREAFSAFVAEKFFDGACRIVREELPGTLILGARFSGDAPDGVMRACGRHCDAISFNNYGTTPRSDEQLISRYWVLGGGKPLMVTEFAWRSRDNLSGNPNTRGAGAVLETRAQRAAAYSSYVEDNYTWPMIIGMHWFEFADQSPQGRFDGENGSYGIVSIKHEPYTELIEAMHKTNNAAHELHAATTRKPPSAIFTPPGPTFQPGQFPDRAPTLDLLLPAGEAVAEPEVWTSPDGKLAWNRDGNVLVLTSDTGSQWGVGINLHGPRTLHIAKAGPLATNLDGYSTIAIDLAAPKGQQINVLINEAAAGESTLVKFDVGAGDDGESFISKAYFASGSRETIRLPIGEITRQMFYGNQTGKNRIDLNAMRSIGIQLQGEPRKGETRIYGWRLER